LSSPPLDHGSIALARRLSPPRCASCVDLVSYLSWSRSSLCNSTCYVYWDMMNIILSTMSSRLLIYYVYVICDLACSSLLVDILA
jgi:hypothetical protein